MRGVLIDLDGVIYQGNNAIDGASGVLAWLQQKGIPHLFVTNTTSKPRAAIVAKLHTMGMDVSEQEILTPVIAARQWLREHGVRSAHYYVPEETLQDFDLLPQDDPEAIVVGDMGESWSFSLLNTMFNQLMASEHKTLLALGMTRYWRKQDQSLQLDVGPFIKALEYALGIEALVLGKPAQPFFDQSCGLLAIPPEEVCMIGDDIRSDIEAAQQAGIAGVQVKTGKFADGDLTLAIKPFVVLDSIADFPTWWVKMGYAIHTP